MSYDYEKTIKLKHTDELQKINTITGEVIKVKLEPSKPRNTDWIPFNPGKFDKMYPAAWEYIIQLLNGRQVKIALQLAMRAAPVTSTLAPFNDDISYSTYGKHFGVSDKTIKKDLARLYEVGVYGKFSLHTKAVVDPMLHKHWVFNPYLMSNGKGISANSLALFENTYIAKICK